MKTFDRIVIILVLSVVAFIFGIGFASIGKADPSFSSYSFLIYTCQIQVSAEKDSQWAEIDLSCEIKDKMLEDLERIPGIAKVEIRDRYRILVKKGYFFEWDELQKEIKTHLESRYLWQ